MGDPQKYSLSVTGRETGRETSTSSTRSSGERFVREKKPLGLRLCDLLLPSKVAKSPFGFIKLFFTLNNPFGLKLLLCILNKLLGLNPLFILNKPFGLKLLLPTLKKPFGLMTISPRLPRVAQKVLSFLSVSARNWRGLTLNIELNQAGTRTLSLSRASS